VTFIFTPVTVTVFPLMVTPGAFDSMFLMAALVTVADPEYSETPFSRATTSAMALLTPKPEVPAVSTVTPTSPMADWEPPMEVFPFSQPEKESTSTEKISTNGAVLINKIGFGLKNWF
jgi:hypothetical protein